jgi:hypothetical protein
MQIKKFLWKDVASGGGGCASLSEAAMDGREGYVVNGVLLDEATRAQIPHLGAGEAAVWVPANVLDRLRDLA